MVLNIPIDRRTAAPAPQSEMAEIREMFREINQLYMVDDVPDLYQNIKRIVDVAVATVFILLVMSWLYPLVALIIKLTSRGPVLFIQERTGYLGLEFDCFKFRTMYVNDEAHLKQATADDKRITPFGRFLRMTHIDEMPQLFNVLLGDMSLVGPRPHMLYHTRYYAQTIPYYNLRHNVVPGMTGMAQIKGYIGEINMERDLRKRIQWDIYYLKNRGSWLDVKIFFITIGQVIGKALHLVRRSGD